MAADNVICSEAGRGHAASGTNSRQRHPPLPLWHRTVYSLDCRAGNAVDAGVAAILCTGVMSPQSCGLGGGHFTTIYNASTKSCIAIDAPRTSPNSIHSAHVRWRQA